MKKPWYDKKVTARRFGVSEEKVEEKAAVVEQAVQRAEHVELELAFKDRRLLHYLKVRYDKAVEGRVCKFCKKNGMETPEFETVYDALVHVHMHLLFDSETKDGVMDEKNMRGVAGDIMKILSPIHHAKMTAEMDTQQKEAVLERVTGYLTKQLQPETDSAITRRSQGKVAAALETPLTSDTGHTSDEASE